ncbi:hypothetical protein EN817_03830 [Mesorhizobium sp. M3A.F.Ca.ET.174.01.1.1]|uniref:hypothetical protein n=1 Tax=unclassified Mesorhizobium TaxID=325217 RepID=UPI0010935672|nr:MULTISPECIES: hypothetical protein [unclassified Mesorhizobium]TGS89480.1 hypothetical protein EN818_03830 [Mesorhizobium sp. M3A.F.Ca.ET.175.01.1.1]TGT31253.1 hypothetical protein EN817_03830 [Mesorhizobium sp. M3A.F.Ca.ET.174.01.1.1]
MEMAQKEAGPAEPAPKRVEQAHNTQKRRKSHADGKTPQARWAEKNPLKRWCHIATNAAIRNGILERLPCSVCGDSKTDAHHVGSYEEPLNCVFLCRRHHVAEHRRLKCEVVS